MNSTVNAKFNYAARRNAVMDRVAPLIQQALDERDGLGHPEDNDYEMFILGEQIQKQRNNLARISFVEYCIENGFPTEVF